MAGWMVIREDPACAEIVKRASALGITGNPDVAACPLGEVTLEGGNKVKAHVLHAVDAIIEDGENVVMINRKNPPGEGQPALPGGFLDPTKGGVESAIAGAMREAMEEVGVDLKDGVLLGKRRMNRPFDVRIAYSDMPQYGIKKGDVFMVSTQAVKLHVPDLKQTELKAGDDAELGSARRVKIDAITPDSVGIPDHFDMIVEAFPEKLPAVPQAAARKNVRSKASDLQANKFNPLSGW